MRQRPGKADIKEMDIEREMEHDTKHKFSAESLIRIVSPSIFDDF